MRGKAICLMALFAVLHPCSACDGLRERSGATQNSDLRQKNAEDVINRRVGEAMSEILAAKISPPSPAPSYPEPRGTTVSFEAASNRHHAEMERWRKEASLATGDDAEVNERVCAVLEILEEGYKNATQKCLFGVRLCRRFPDDEWCGLIAIPCEESRTRNFQRESLIERAESKYGCRFFGPTALLFKALEAAPDPSEASPR